MSDGDSKIQTGVLRLIAAVDALHKNYPSTAVCYGGVGGQMITPHCGWTCENTHAHDAEREEYYAARKALDELLF